MTETLYNALAKVLLLFESYENQFLLNTRVVDLNLVTIRGSSQLHKLPDNDCRIFSSSLHIYNHQRTRVGPVGSVDSHSQVRYKRFLSILVCISHTHVLASARRVLLDITSMG